MKLTNLGSYTLRTKIICALLTISVSIFSFGCAAGGYQLTRALAKWNNSFSVLPRVVIYLIFFILPVYAISLIIDFILNIGDFWQGKVSAMNTTYEKDGYEVKIAHSYTPLRNTLITMNPKKEGLVGSVIEFKETASASIEVLINGVKKGEVKNINEVLPVLLTFNSTGTSVESTKVIDTRLFKNLPDSTARLNLALVQSALSSDSAKPELSCQM